MGKKIFVSYKYADDSVRPLLRGSFGLTTTAHHYVQELREIIESHGDNIYKGEDDNNDLSSLSDDSIWNELKQKIFDSSVTIVLISPNMYDCHLPEKEQWIPNEIAYSLRKKHRDGRPSNPNALLGIILPSKNGNDGYVSYMKQFSIIKKNLECDYMVTVSWDAFLKAPSQYIDYAIYRKEHVPSYRVCRSV